MKHSKGMALLMAAVMTMTMFPTGVLAAEATETEYLESESLITEETSKLETEEREEVLEKESEDVSITELDNTLENESVLQETEECEVLSNIEKESETPEDIKDNSKDVLVEIQNKKDKLDQTNSKSAEDYETGLVLFESNILCTVGENTIITATVTLPENQSVINTEWSCEDTSALVFSGTSVQGPSVTGQKGVYWVSVMVQSTKVGDYQVTLKVNGTITGKVFVCVGEEVRIGKLTSYSNEQITIDNVKYSLANDYDFDYSNDKIGKDIFYSCENGKVKCVRLVSDVIVPQMALKSLPDSFIYENGSYNDTKHSVQVIIDCTISRYCPFSYDSIKRIASDRIISVYKYNLKIMGDYINFGREGVIFKKDIEEISSTNVSLKFGERIKYEYDLYVKEDLIPNEVNNCVQVEGSITLSDGRVYEDKKHLNIYIINLDKQKAAVEEAKKQSETTVAAKRARQSLAQCTAISLDGNLLEYLTNQQISEIEDYLIVYTAKVLTAEKVEDKSFFDKIDDDIRTKLKDKILSALHVNKKALLGAKTTTGSTYVSCMTKNGEKIIIDFSIKLDEYTLGERTPYASMAAIDYKSSIEGKSISGKGMATLANMESFADSMLDFLKIAYDYSWGKKANEVAAMFDAKPIDWLLDGDYSGKIYELSVDCTKSVVTKKAIIQCPVDVYVYDQTGALCLSIEDNIITQSDSLVSAAVNGDEKTLYCYGGDYYIRLKGTDTGLMNYQICEMIDGEVVREFQQKSIPLVENIEYETLIPAMRDVGKDVYVLRDETDEVVGTVTDSLPTDRNIVTPIGIHYKVENGNKLILFGEGSTGYYKDDPPWQEYADQITEVVIQPGFSTIGYASFYEFSHIEKVEIPQSVERIEDYAFYGCSNLSELSLPDSIKYIGKGAFDSCSLYSPEKLPDSLNTLGDFAFFNSGIKSISLGENLKKAGDCVFAGAPLEEVYLNSKEVDSFDNTFRGCRLLKKVYIGASVESLNEEKYYSDHPFMGIGFQTEYSLMIIVAEDNPNYSSDEGVLFNKDKSTLIFNPCYSGREEYSVPESVKRIESGAFYNSNLKKIELPNQLESIGEEAFHGSDITELIIPDSVVSIGKSVARFCSDLEKVELSNSISVIPEYAFSSCLKLVHIDLPNSITKLEDSCFDYSGLTEIDIKDGVREIGKEAFSVTHVKYFTIPKSVTSIGKDAFSKFGITKVVFCGDIPAFPEGFADEACGAYSAMYVYYPANNTTWSQEKLESLSINDWGDNFFLIGYNKEIINQDKFNLPSRDYYIKEGETISISPQIIPSNATNQHLNYEPVNDFAAECISFNQKGEITGKTLGEGIEEDQAVLYVKAIDSDYSDIIHVFVRSSSYGEDTPDNPQEPFMSNGSLDEGENVITIGEGKTAYYSFTPETDGEYTISSVGEDDTFGYLYDDAQVLLTSDDNSGDNTNFKFQYSMTAGQEYYIGAKFNDSKISGTTTIMIEAEEEPVDPGEPYTISGSIYEGNNEISIDKDPFDTLIYVSFTPKESGRYSIYTTGENDTFGHLYDGEWDELKWNEDAGTEFNFKITNSFIAGNVYYIGIGFNGYDDSGSISLVVEKSTTGTCGENLTWTWDEGLLTISGTGDMTDYFDDSPWEEDDTIISIVVEDGVTSIGSMAFESLSSLKEVDISNSVTRLGECSFVNCQNLENITIPEGVRYIDPRAFQACNNLKSVIIPSSVSIISDEVFIGCENLTSATIYSRNASFGEYVFSLAGIGDGGIIQGGSNFTLYGYANSTAESYAREHSIIFKSLDEEEKDISGCTITVENATYTGKALAPAVIVKDGDTTLKKDTDYTLEYKNNVNAGTGTVAITGKGSYTGSVHKTFTINKASQTLEVSVSSSSIAVGGTVAITASGTGAITYSSSNTKVAVVDEQGIITGIATGTATITVKAAGDQNFKEASKTLSISVILLSTPVLSKVESVYGGVRVTWAAVTGAENYRVYRKTRSGSWTRIGDTTEPVYLDTTAKSGTRYVYTVRCLNKDATAFTSSFDRTGKAIIFIASPVLGKAENVNGGVKISWSKVTGAVKYRVFRKTAGTGWKKVADTTALNYTDKTAVSGTEYTYTVRCINRGGTGYTSGFDANGLTITYVQTPVLSKVESVYGGVRVTWAAVNGAENYRVYRKTGSGSWTKIGDTTEPVYLDTTAKSSVRYVYTVRCLNKDATAFTSSFDRTGKAIIFIASPVLGKAENVNGGVKISWSKVTGAVKYRVFRRSAGTGWKKVADTTALTYTDTTAVSGTEYTYTVRCINKAGTGYTSGFDANGLTIKYLQTPVLLRVENIYGGVKVTWAEVPGAENYRVYRKTGSGSWTRIGDTTKTVYTDAAVVSGTKYTYTIRCLNKDATAFTSSFNRTGKGVTYIAAPALNDPKIVSGGIQISWGKVPGAVKYRVFRKTADSNWIRLANTTALTYTDKTAVSGIEYRYTVRCISSDGKVYTSNYDVLGKTVVAGSAYARDQYAKVIFDDSYGQQRIFCYHIPEIVLLDGTKAAANEQIRQDMMAILEEGVFPYEGENEPMIASMLYQWGISGDTLSVVIQTSMQYYWFDYYVYNISLTTGQLVDSKALLAQNGYTEDSFYAAAGGVMTRYMDEYVRNFGMGDEDFNEIRTKTLTESNIKSSIPFIKPDGSIGFVANIYSAAGADHYYHLMNLEGEMESDRLKCGIDHTEGY